MLFSVLKAATYPAEQAEQEVEQAEQAEQAVFLRVMRRLL